MPVCGEGRGARGGCLRLPCAGPEAAGAHPAALCQQGSSGAGQGWGCGAGAGGMLGMAPGPSQPGAAPGAWVGALARGCLVFIILSRMAWQSPWGLWPPPVPLVHGPVMPPAPRDAPGKGAWPGARSSSSGLAMPGGRGATAACGSAWKLWWPACRGRATCSPRWSCPGRRIWGMLKYPIPCHLSAGGAQDPVGMSERNQCWPKLRTPGRWWLQVCSYPCTVTAAAVRLSPPGRFSPLGSNVTMVTPSKQKPTHGRTPPGGAAGSEAPPKLIGCMEPQVPPSKAAPCLSTSSKSAVSRWGLHMSWGPHGRILG